MPEDLAAVLQWAVPALIVLGASALAVVVIVWVLRRARTSRRARAKAEVIRDQAGITLVRLDDAVAELDLEVGLSGALYGGGAPASLRRARLSAQHVRDESFAEFRTISDAEIAPAEVTRAAARIERRCASALNTVAAAQREHTAWMRVHVSAAEQIAAARGRLDQVRASMGDPSALVAQLSARFADDEWREAARAAHAAVAETAEAARLLAAATETATDPSRNALGELAQAERALRQAETDARILEESHRLVLQAAVAVPDEILEARAALSQAAAMLPHVPAADAERFSAQLRAEESTLEDLQTDAARHPLRTIDAIARVRTRIDLATGTARTAQQRIRGARTALPGTLAAARNVIAQAEASIAHSQAGADARSRLASAGRELALARQGNDPVQALDAARRAMRDAEDAKALADYARMPRG